MPICRRSILRKKQTIEKAAEQIGFRKKLKSKNAAEQIGFRTKIKIKKCCGAEGLPYEN